MRIIAGKYKSRIIDAPKDSDVRPTTDRVREAMFSSVVSLLGTLDGASAFDAFAGTGALGFECISRGAKYVVAFENDIKTYKNLIKNRDSLDLSKNVYSCFNADVKMSSFKMLDNIKFDVLFFDPPYITQPFEVIQILDKLKNNNNIFADAVVVYEHSASVNFCDIKNNFEEAKFKWINGKIYGDIAIDYMMFRGENNE